MIIMEIEINEDGYVLNNGIHDAEIIDINVSNQSENVIATLVCKSEKGELFTFRFQGICVLNVSLFVQQNVIRDLIVKKYMDAEDDLKDIADLETYSFYKVNDLNNKIKNGEFTLARFVPSVGADVIIICKDVILNG